MGTSLNEGVVKEGFHRLMDEVHAKSLQLCPTPCDPINCSLPGSSVHGMLQARILEWITIPFSKASSQPRNLTYVSCIAGGFCTHRATWEANTYTHTHIYNNCIHIIAIFLYSIHIFAVYALIIFCVSIYFSIRL